MFLNDDELHELTGYELHGWQRRWLKAHGYAFEVAANGRPVVLRALVERKLGLQSAKKPKEPDFGALSRAAQ